MRTFVMLLLGLVLAGALPAVEITTVEGQAVQGRALTVRDGMLSIDTKRIPLDEVRSCRWERDAQASPEGRTTFVLEGGDLLVGTVVSSEGDTVTVQSLSFGMVNVDLRYLLSICLTAPCPQTPEAGQGRDRLVFANGDALEGFVRKLSNTGVIFESVIGKMHYAYTDVREIRLLAGRLKPSRPDSAYFRVTTRHGEMVTGIAIQEEDGGVSVTSFLLGTLRVGPDDLSRLEVVNGRLVFITDMVPAAVEEKPFWKDGFVWRYRADASIDGNPLRLNGREFARGLGVHSFCRIAYDLDKKYERFIAYFGIDDEVTNYGAVDVRVLGDGTVLFERQNVRWDAEPVRVEVDTGSIRRLELIVDFGETLDIGDHADWAGAYFIRKR